MGLYSHTTRAAGTVVTATIYNGDHQNHIDNQDGAHVLGEALDVAGIRTTQDPYSAQVTEDVSASDSIQRDVRHLRYVLGQLNSYANGSAPTAAAATALGSALGQWYFGIRNPAFKLAGVRVLRTASFTHTASGTRQAVDYPTASTTEEYDQDGAAVGFHEGVTNPSRLTVPANLGGKFEVGGTAAFPASATGVQREVAIRKNGATFLGAQRTSWAHTAGNVVELTVNVTAALVATDYVELIINQDIGATQAIGGPNNVNGPHFWMHLVGA
jgi:hypothetical protein